MFIEGILLRYLGLPLGQPLDIRWISISYVLEARAPSI